MLLNQVSDAQLQAGRILAGAAIIALLAAPMFRHRAQAVRLVVAVVYIAGISGLLLYALL